MGRARLKLWLWCGELGLIDFPLPETTWALTTQPDSEEQLPPGLGLAYRAWEGLSPWAPVRALGQGSWELLLAHEQSRIKPFEGGEGAQ